MDGPAVTCQDWSRTPRAQDGQMAGGGAGDVFVSELAQPNGKSLLLSIV